MKRHCRPTFFLSLFVALAFACGAATFDTSRGDGGLTVTCRVTGRATPLDLFGTRASDGYAATQSAADGCCDEVTAPAGGKEATHATLHKAACCDVRVAAAQDKNATPRTPHAAKLFADCAFAAEQSLFPPRTTALTQAHFGPRHPSWRGPAALCAAAPRGPPHFS